MPNILVLSVLYFYDIVYMNRIFALCFLGGLFVWTGIMQSLELGQLKTFSNLFLQDLVLENYSLLFTMEFKPTKNQEERRFGGRLQLQDSSKMRVLIPECIKGSE